VSKKKSNQKHTINQLPSYFLMLACCLIIPLLHFKTTLDPVLYPRFTGWAVTIAILLFLIWFTFKKNKYSFPVLKDKFFISFLLFIGVSIITLIYSINPVEGLTDLFKWIMILLFIGLVTILFLYSEDTLSLILKGVVINAILFGILGLAQYLNFAFNSTDPNAIYEVKSLMAHKNQYSISLFVLLPFLLSGLFKFNRLWFRLDMITISLVVINIFLLQTRAVWIAVFISLILVFVFIMLKSDFLPEFFNRKVKKRILLVLLMAVSLLVLLSVIAPQYSPVFKIYQRIATLFNPEFTSNEWRIEMWTATLALIKDNPVIGVGGGNWKISIYPYYGEYLPSVFRHWRNPHNDYLNIIAEKGIVGLVTYLIPFILIYMYAIKNILSSRDKKEFWTNTFMLSGISGYLVIMLFTFPNERINHPIFLSLMVGYILSVKYRNLTQRKIDNSKYVKPIFITLLVLAYLPIHFGFICLRSEMNIAKAQSAQKNGDWAALTHFADQAYYHFAPLEPSFSFPVSLYQGLGRYNQSKFKEALPYFERAFKQHPTNTSVLNNLGSVYAQMKELDSAVFYYNKTIEIFPHYEYGLINMAKTYYVLKDYQVAYQYVLSCDPKSKTKEIIQLKAEIEKKLDN